MYSSVRSNPVFIRCSGKAALAAAGNHPHKYLILLKKYGWWQPPQKPAW
jgi:hypothetical protein